MIDDGDSGFHNFQAFYPSVDKNGIRTRVIVELCVHEQYYNSLASQHGFDLVDGESVQDHCNDKKMEFVDVVMMFIDKLEGAAYRHLR